jgi:hypothetical protein
MLFGLKGQELRFPAATNWCDAIGSDGPNRLTISKRVISGRIVTNFETSRVELSLFVDPARPKLRCGFAFNSKLAGLPRNQVNPSTVMLFESGTGWNAAGGPELASAPHGKIIIVALVDGSVQVIPTTQIQQLRWNPEN